MRREDELNGDLQWVRPLPPTTVRVRCCRKEHIITIKNERIHLEGHNGVCLATLLQEHQLSKATELKGCYYFVSFLLRPPAHLRPYEFEPTSRRRRRPSVLVEIEKAGVNERDVREFFRRIIMRRAHRDSSQNYVDAFEIPFAESAAYRINRLYAAQRAEQERKKNRVVSFLEKQGITPHKDAHLLQRYQW